MSRKVLVVDNDFFFVEFLSELLEGRGYQVIKAYDGKEAIGILESDSIDLLFLDIVMPKIDGRKVIQFVRARFSPVAYPIVVMSGSVIERLDELEKINADYYIAKGPLDKMEAEIVNFLGEFEKPDFRMDDSDDSNRFFEAGNMYPRQETAELVELIEYQKSVLESLAIGVLVLDRDARIVHANPGVLRIFGMNIDGLLNRAFTSLFHHEDRPLIIGALKDLLAGGNRSSRRLKAGTGTGGTVSVSMSVLYVEGKSAGWTAVVEDASNG